MTIIFTPKYYRCSLIIYFINTHRSSFLIFRVKRLTSNNFLKLKSTGNIGSLKGYLIPFFISLMMVMLLFPGIVSCTVQSGSTFLHSLIKLANKTHSKLQSHLAVFRAFFNLLCSLALSAECRGVMWKVWLRIGHVTTVTCCTNLLSGSINPKTRMERI